VDWEQALNQSIDQELDAAESASETSDHPMTDTAEAPAHTDDAPQEPLPAFAKPSVELTGSILERPPGQSNLSSHEPVDNQGTPLHVPVATPQIRPIPSPGLPIPSPLISNHSGSAGYFLPWTPPTQPEDTRSVPAETCTIETPEEPSIEIHDTDATDPIPAEAVEELGPDIEPIQQEHVLDAGFIFRDDAASHLGSESLQEEREVEIIDSGAIYGSDVIKAEVILNPTGDEAQVSTEAQQSHASDDVHVSRDHPASLPGSESESAAAQAGISTEDAVDEAQTDHERIIDVSYLWRDDSASSSRSDEDPEDGPLEPPQAIDRLDAKADLGMETANDNVESLQHPAGPYDEEHFKPDQSASAFDQDAIDALGQMIAVREEEKQRKRDMEEKKENEEDIDGSSVAGGAFNRSPGQGYSEEKDEVYYAESVENYDSQNEYDEEEEEDEDDFSVEPSDERFEQEQQHQPSQTGDHEVIVLDSDSDDEPTSNHPVASASQSAERDDSSYRVESGLPVVSPATANSASGVQEYPEPWYVDGESGYRGTVGEDSDINESEESEEIEEPEYNRQDDRVHESDMEDDESTPEHYPTDHPSETSSSSPDEDQDKEMEDAELIEEADNDESYAAANMDAQVDVAVDQDADGDQSGNTDPNLLPESHLQGPSSEMAPPNPTEGEDEMEDAELIEEAGNDESYAANPGAQVEVAVDRAADEEQPGNVDPNLPDMPESHSQGPSSEMVSPNLTEGEDQEMEDVGLIEEAGSDESDEAVVEPDAQIEVAIDREAEEEEQLGNVDPNLLDMPESHPQGRSLEMESHAGQSLDADQHSDLHIPSSAGNLMDDFPLTREPTVEGPEPLGGRVSPSIMPPVERQLLTPDPTQENTSTRELVYNVAPEIEPEISFTIEESEAPTGLDRMSQTAGSPKSDKNDDVGAELTKEIQQAMYVDGHYDVETTPQLAEAAEPPRTPEATRAVEVVINTESPRGPAAPVGQYPVPDRNASGLRSKLSYFAPLATLIDHYDNLVDTISIVHEASPIARAKSGSKDWFVTIQLTDPSMAGTTLRAQIFRRHKSSMPSLVQGTAILLRDFKVRSFDHTVMLVSVESSAWAVFDGSGPDAEVNGPPVEYGSQERAYASGLRRWYEEIGFDRIADRMLQEAIARDSQERDLTPSSQVPSESGSPDSRRGSQRKRKSNRRVTIHELRDGTRYTEVGSPNSRNSSVHELRDGTLYANI
jgi:hypothetical protein